MRNQISLFGLWFALLSVALAGPASAAAVPPSIAQSIVEVICADRQGSGFISNVSEGNVLTNGHVAIDTATGVAQTACVVGFLGNATDQPRSYYDAAVVHAVFNERKNQDYAVLKIGSLRSGHPVTQQGMLKTNEFAAVGDAVTIYGYPGNDGLRSSSGTVNGFSRGSVATDSVISQGDSGGPAVDANNNVIGLATRIITSVDQTTGVEKLIDYDLVDILSIINWLDTFGPHSHDQFITHADPQRFDGAPFVIRDEQPGCTDFVRTTLASTVYCLLPESKRLVFPNSSTYFSWLPDFTKVKLATIDDISQFQLIGNVTFKAGTLVKIVTDPKVYVAIDSIGTLRYIPSEERAIQLFGGDWAQKVKDIPVEFFTDYPIAAPLE
jgi:V8-like Glu-specific endopeptidase